MPSISEVSGVVDPSQLCQQCGHVEGDHIMHPAQMPFPTDGWVTCPVPACDCYGTWTVDEESRPHLERRRAEALQDEAESRATDAPAG